ncbi:helix-turn-helix domain-containing protein [Nocardia seriolae]|uniref:XRE family transcriptional regulator n=1 Tax=Nocardia seriolae TaxID=37332 RepID=A0ABC9YNC9_9NOCA|nr:helix-turn-helix transcriptional regulator [Nocardia seriolae]BEK94235.1 helix-turn-helix transcriptional regulator [Nocardia seriolae]GAM44967.1 XRE family transcriptional regulator [Nocardia seriolae]GAP26987.1 XRE family transcriptional regulator [Nocardia seriolae]
MGSIAGVPDAESFGERLRQWRRIRHVSQVELAGRIGVAARQLSLIESGRAHPERELVVRVIDALDLGLPDRNQLLQAAGFAPAYPDVPVHDPRWHPFTTAIDRLLRAHEPFPALVVDAYGTVFATNRSCARLFGQDPVGTNMIDRYIADSTAPGAAADWREVAWVARARLRAQLARAPLDDRLPGLIGRLDTMLDDLPAPDRDPDGLVAHPTFRIGAHLVRTGLLAARFDAAIDITLEELRIELFYPLDPGSEEFFRSR